jgi:hypothetical protein
MFCQNLRYQETTLMFPAEQHLLFTFIYLDQKSKMTAKYNIGHYGGDILKIILIWNLFIIIWLMQFEF